MAGRAVGRPLRVVLRAREVPVTGRRRRLGRARRRPRGRTGAARHPRRAAPSRRGAQPRSPSPMARGVGLREGHRRAHAPARRSRRGDHAGRRPGLPGVDRGRPPGSPGRRRPGLRSRRLLRRGHRGVARPGVGRREGRLDRRSSSPVRGPWSRGAAARTAPPRMPGRAGAAERRGPTRLGSDVDGLGAGSRPRRAPGGPPFRARPPRGHRRHHDQVRCLGVPRLAAPASRGRGCARPPALRR